MKRSGKQRGRRMKSRRRRKVLCLGYTDEALRSDLSLQTHKHSRVGTKPNTGVSLSWWPEEGQQTRRGEKRCKAHIQKYQAVHQSCSIALAQGIIQKNKPTKKYKEFTIFTETQKSLMGYNVKIFNFKKVQSLFYYRTRKANCAYRSR